MRTNCAKRRTINLSRGYFLLGLTCVLLLFSCLTKSTNIQNKLIGTWVLDSELYPRGGIHKVSGETRIIKFLDKSSYTYEWWQEDLTNKYYGNYFILQNPNRKLYTIAFVPDLQIFETDTNREYMNFDIISLTDSSLETFEESKNVKNSDGSYSRFNGRYIYKRHR